MVANIIDRIPREVYAFLNDVGIPSHIKGYDYLAYAVFIVANDPSKLLGVTKILYPETAKVFGTTPSRVERAMRHAIESLFWDIDNSKVQRYFGNSISKETCRPTNSQFISTISREYRRTLI